MNIDNDNNTERQTVVYSGVISSTAYPTVIAIRSAGMRLGL